MSVCGKCNGSGIYSYQRGGTIVSGPCDCMKILAGWEPVRYPMSARERRLVEAIKAERAAHDALAPIYLRGSGITYEQADAMRAAYRAARAETDAALAAYDPEPEGRVT